MWKGSNDGIPKLGMPSFIDSLNFSRTFSRYPFRPKNKKVPKLSKFEEEKFKKLVVILL